MVSEYTFKFLIGDQYADQTDNLVSFYLDVKQVAENWTFIKISDIEKAYLSQSTLHNFETLLVHYKLCHLKDLLINIAVNLQFAFITNEEIYDDKIIDDFVREDSEYKKLLNIIEEYLFNTDNKLQSISVNFSKKTIPTALFKNEYLLDEIMLLIINNLGITKDNFFQRRDEILIGMTHVRKGYGGEFIRSEFVSNFFNFLQKSIPYESAAELLRFIGCFLHICEIPYHSIVSEIQINSIDDELKSIDIQYMKHYIHRPKKKIFTNN